MARKEPDLFGAKAIAQKRGGGDPRKCCEDRRRLLSTRSTLCIKRR